MKTIILIFVLFVFSCQQGKKSEVAELKDAVMAIHDESMPKMGELRKIRRNLMLQADSLKVSDSTRAVVLLVTAEEIAAANEGMMDWMRNYEPEYTGTKEEILFYLGEQRKSIQKVKEDMEKSLIKGKEMLKQR